MKIDLPERPWLAYVAFLVLLAFVDFHGRVYVARNDSTRPVSPPVLKAPPLGDSPEVIIKRLSEWLPVEVQARKVGPTAEDWSLEAVFVTRRGSRAVLALRGGEGQITRRVRLGVGDESEGWRIEAIEPRKVVMSHEGVSVEIGLFKRAATAGGGG